MDDIAEGALEGASTEAVSAVEAASEATENTEGQTHEAPADAEAQAKAEAEETERKSRNERRREARERAERDRIEAESRARAAADQLARAQAAAKALPAPKQDDFPTFEEYQAKLTAYAVATAMDERTLKGMEAQAREAHAQMQAARTAAETTAREHVATSIQEARSRYADFDRVALQEAPIDQRLMQLISGTDHPADIAYWLGQNKAEGERIRTLAHQDPMGAMRALGRIEAQVSTPKPVPVTAAPEPIAPVRGKAAPPKNPASMSVAEYRAWRESGGIPA